MQMFFICLLSVAFHMFQNVDRNGFFCRVTVRKLCLQQRDRDLSTGIASEVAS